MKQTPWSICIGATLAFAMISCKSSSSLGSSKVLQDSTETYTQAQSDDCLAWKFTIMATLNHMIWQKNMDLVFEQKQNDPNFAKDHGSYYKLVDMNKIFPQRPLALFSTPSSKEKEDHATKNCSMILLVYSMFSTLVADL